MLYHHVMCLTTAPISLSQNIEFPVLLEQRNSLPEHSDQNRLRLFPILIIAISFQIFFFKLDNLRQT